MSKFDDAVSKYMEEFGKIGVSDVDETLLRSVTKACGPSIYNADASKVSSSDQAELDRVKANFCEKKLSVSGDAADAAIARVVDKLGASNRNKYRAMFYYLLVKDLGKESNF